jgi:hypothetical protein
MKRLVVFAMVTILAGFAVQANAGKMYGGIKGGVNFADLKGDDAPDNTSMRTGFMGGVFAGTNVNEDFGFRVEVLWAQKGAKADSANVEVTYKADYVDIPLLFVFNVSSSESMVFSLFAGPSLNFNISAKTEVDGTDYDIDNIESFEFGGAIGAGIAKKMAGGKAVGLDARYSLGATSIIGDVAGESVSVKNSGIGVMVFFQVPLGAQD